MVTHIRSNEDWQDPMLTVQQQIDKVMRNCQRLQILIQSTEEGSEEQGVLMQTETHLCEYVLLMRLLRDSAKRQEQEA